MGIPVEHELHTRRRSRNVGLLVVLLALVVVIFGMTMVKLQRTGDPSAFQGFDHDIRWGLANQADGINPANGAASEAAEETGGAE